MKHIISRFACLRSPGPATHAGAFVVGALALMPQQQAAHAASPAEVGVWINHTGKGAVEIAPCGTSLCGRIVWLKEPLNAEGVPKFDRHNPDASKRTRPICGLPVIGNLKRTSDGWDEGWVYNPEEGTQADVAIVALAKNTLTVTGYKGIKLFSQTMTWTRAPADLQKCGEPSGQTKASPPAGVPKAGVGNAEKPPAAKPAAAAPAPPPSKKDAAKATAPKSTAPKAASAPKASAPGDKAKAADKGAAKSKQAAQPAAGQPKQKAAAVPAAKAKQAQQPAAKSKEKAAAAAAKPAPAKKKTADEADATSTAE